MRTFDLRRLDPKSGMSQVGGTTFSCPSNNPKPNSQLDKCKGVASDKPRTSVSKCYRYGGHGHLAIQCLTKRDNNLLIEGTREGSDTREDVVNDQEELERLESEICRGYTTPSDELESEEEGYIAYIGESNDYPLSSDLLMWVVRCAFTQQKFEDD